MPARSGRSSRRQLSKILRQVWRQRLDLLVPLESITHAPTRGLLKCLRWLTLGTQRPRGIRVRDTFLALGPVYIKLGQLLSTRRDLLPADIADELATLQDQVPPIANFDLGYFLSESLGHSYAEVFKEIDPVPLASASIAQVHTAKLNTGEEVVLKIVRPHIQDQIDADMQLLSLLANRVNHYIPAAQRLHLPKIVADHHRVLLQELNMFSEARNQIKLRRNFAESNLLYVPRVYAQQTREKLLVMERVHGIPINQVQTLRERGVNLQVLAHKGVETFFKQVFEHNFFHADMHPGNILVAIQDPHNPSYIALDCAIIGSLTDADQHYLAQNLLAFFNRDYRQVVMLHLASGWVPAETDPDAFEAVIRALCEPIFAKPLDEISFAEFIAELLDTAGQFNMELQPQLVLLQKTLLYIEGVGRQLYPQLDLWTTAKPFMEKWAVQHLGPAAIINNWISAGPKLWQQLPYLPTMLTQNEDTLRLLKSTTAQQSRRLSHLERQLKLNRRRRRGRTIAGLIFVGISFWLLWTPLALSLSGGNFILLTGTACAITATAMLLKS